MIAESVDELSAQLSLAIILHHYLHIFGITWSNLDQRGRLPFTDTLLPLAGLHLPSTIFGSLLRPSLRHCCFHYFAQRVHEHSHNQLWTAANFASSTLSTPSATMTLFIASLFLPYTINFDSNEPTPETTSRQPSLAQPSEADQPSRTVSLWTPGPSNGAITNASIPKTPGATTNLETIFQPYIERPFNLTAPSPRGKAKHTPVTNGSNASLQTISTVRNPHLMPLSDLYSPSEITSPFWNQPTSRAGPAPPIDVRHHKAQVQDQRASVAWKSTRTSREKSRNSSNERKFTEENYTVRSARRGNGGLWQAIDAVSDAGLLADKTWVGTLGMATDVLDKHLKSVIFERLEDDYQSLV